MSVSENSPKNKGLGSIVRTYDYADESGELQYQVVRYDPKDFRPRRPAPDSKSGWAWNLEGVHRVPYRLPGLLNADPAATVYIVEGEKDADNLTAIGLTATAFAGGANGWRKEYAECFRGRTICFIADKDEPGRRFGAAVAKGLRGVAATVAILELPGDGIKDASDWLALPGNDAAALQAMAEAALAARPAESPAGAKEESDGDSKEEKISAATACVKLALAQGVELFHDASKTAYATVPAGTARQTMPLKSVAFKTWLRGLYYGFADKALPAQSLADAVGVLESKALFDSPCIDAHVRTAERHGAYYIDLGGDDWTIAEIDSAGWRLVPSGDSLVKFRRPRGLLPMPKPAVGGNLDALREFVNLADNRDNWLLLLGWLFGALRPTGPYPVLLLTGEQGSAKSTTGRLLRELVDPNKAPLRSEPRDERDLAIAANNGWIVALDNLSRLTPGLSDALCRLATGGGFATRELYTDSDEIIFDAKRPVVITSIEDVVDRNDLLDRALLIRLAAIPEEKRRPEKDIWAAFDQARPAILGALLSAISDGLLKLPDVKPAQLPRMADFALWAEACCRAVGVPDSEFLSAYRRNRADADEQALEGCVVWPVLKRFMDGRAEFQGTARELLASLDTTATDAERKQQGWPKRADKLSGRIKRIAPNLRRMGWSVEFVRVAHGRTITISSRGSAGKVASLASIAPSADETLFGKDSYAMTPKNGMASSCDTKPESSVMPHDTTFPGDDATMTPKEEVASLRKYSSPNDLQEKSPVDDANDATLPPLQHGDSGEVRRWVG